MQNKRLESDYFSIQLNRLVFVEEKKLENDQRSSQYRVVQEWNVCDN